MAKVTKLKKLEGALSTALTPEAQTPEEREETQAEALEGAKKCGLLFHTTDLDPMLTHLGEAMIHLYRLHGSVASHLWRPDNAADTLRLGMFATMTAALSENIGATLMQILSPAQMGDLIKANPQVVQGLVAAYGPERLPDRVEARAAARVGN